MNQKKGTEAQVQKYDGYSMPVSVSRIELDQTNAGYKQIEVAEYEMIEDDSGYSLPDDNILPKFESTSRKTKR